MTEPSAPSPPAPGHDSHDSPDGLGEFLRRVRRDFDRLIMEHTAANREMTTKLAILRDEFLQFHRYNPIEHMSSRVKSVDSLTQKLMRKGCEPTLEAIRANITDLAGVRVTCSFISDTYRLLDLLGQQDDVRVIEVKDYIAAPKPNGYRSLHALIEIPVFFSTGATPVVVEVQLRTIAMDFWASLEHKIAYKYGGAVPEQLRQSLADAATTAGQLDHRMEALHQEVADTGGQAAYVRGDESLLRSLWDASNRHASAQSDASAAVAPRRRVTDVRPDDAHQGCGR